MAESTVFEQLLQAAAAQPDPQRLLFVFAAAELPADATPVQRERFAQGRGGALEPLACVDRRPDELSTFEALVAESRTASPPWQVVFVAGLSGRDGRPPSDQEVDASLTAMVNGVRRGEFCGCLTLDAQGQPLEFC
ncbi:ribonucleotide reductase subunit alpha [Caenimonas terrae]|uniref:Ribonucleotide reductase subunit alpha n=1 Tax=Caenimonas terrae TaxID=696074 RepID=A0ABW0N9U8_9BURK